MRIISQKGIEPMLDLPYEQVVLMVNGKFITAIVPGGADMLIARYSTPEKSEKAMEKLWYSVNNVQETIENISEKESELQFTRYMNCVINRIPFNEPIYSKREIDADAFLNNIVYKNTFFFPEDLEV